MLLLCLINFVCAVQCVLFESNSSEPLWKQLEALEHVHTFLVEVQEEIKESRDLLRHINNENVLKYSTDAPPKIGVIGPVVNKTLQRDLSRYQSPTTPQSFLRTYHSNSVTAGSTSTNPTIASVAKLPGPQKTSKMPFLMAHDYVIPDLVPYYRDIFAPELHRQGDANETDLGPYTFSSTNSEVTTKLSTVRQVLMDASDIHMLFTETTTVSSVGDLLFGRGFTQTTPEIHPQLHKQIIRDTTGYFSVGVENLMMLVATKDPEHVQAVLEPAYLVVENLHNYGNRSNLRWMGNPMTDVMNYVTSILAPGVIDIQETQLKAKMLWMLMKNRRTMLGERVNQILDFADGMVKKEDGERIFDRLDDFLHFPNVTREFLRPYFETGSDLCDALIRAFDAPFSYETADRHRLANAANGAIRDHYGTEFKDRRNAGFWPKVDIWLTTHHKPNTKRMPKFKQSSPRPRAWRVSASHRSMIQPRGVHKHKKWTRPTNPQPIYNRARAIRNKPLTNTFGSTEKIFTKRFKYDRKKLTTKPMISRNSVFQRTTNYAKATQEVHAKNNKITKKRFNRVAHSQKADQPHHEKADSFSKWITNYTEPCPEKYLTFRRRPNDFRRENVTSNPYLEKYPQQLKQSYSDIKFEVTKSKPSIKFRSNTNYDTIEIQSEDFVTINDNSRSSINSTDEEEILDVNLLNRLLNVSAEESLEDQKSLNVSIETDDDVEILKHLKEVFYE